MKLVVKAKNGAKPAKEFTLVEGKDYKVKYECTEGNIIGKAVTATGTEITNKNFINKNVTLSDTSTLTAKSKNS